MISKFSRHLFFGTVAAMLTLFFSVAPGCSSFLGRETRGAVTFYNDIPDQCNTTRGLKQKTVIRATSESQLRSHYGLTFLVRFQDGVSPPVYGTLYYQNEDLNRYCMATPGGRFAVFANSRVNGVDNIVQEVCYPIKDCGQ
ncbi:MAG: hypothetical protein NXI24_18035 [bacterium]|nr:hypothetical protein [bacterium]